MQAALSFQFPHQQAEVPVKVLIPLPEQRPRTVCNFVFMATGQLPAPDMLHALGIPSSDVAYADAESAAAAGLIPFSGTAVVRVEKKMLIEIGSSTKCSIFGGFIRDEPLALPEGSARGSVAANMLQLKAGTILCGNVGIPNSHASRYYILLVDATSDDLRAEFSSFIPLGMITGGLQELNAAANKVPVQPRTMTPLKSIKLSGCKLEYDYQHLAQNIFGAGNNNNNSVGSSGAPRERPTARVRGRDEDEEEDAQPQFGSGGGFFRFDAKFPTGRNKNSSGPAAKRHRAEAVVYDENGSPVLRTTAIASSANDGESFNYFNAQESAFMNDIDLIRDVQDTRIHHKMRRAAKQTHHNSKGGSSSSRGKSAKALRSKALRNISGRSSQSGKGKKLNKRY